MPQVPACKVLILYSANVAVCGIGSWIEMLVEGLEPAGYEVTEGLAWGACFHQPAIVRTARPQLKTVAMDGRTGTEEGRIRAIERTILAMRPDIVILTCLDDAFAAVRRLRTRGHTFFRFIITNHGNLPEHAARILEEQDLADLIVCVGRLAHQSMVAAGGAEVARRLRHIPNAVPVPLVAPGEHSAGRMRIGYAGRLYDFKRTGDLVPFYREVLRSVPHAELWVAGEGSHADGVAALETEMPGQVRYWGVCSREQLYLEFYPQIDVLAHFSASEGFGLTIAEAMAHGVVPVTSAFAGWQCEGLIADGETALVFPVGDVAVAAGLVEMLAQDPDLWRRLSAAGQAHVQSRFSPAVFSDNWLEAIDFCRAQPLAKLVFPPSLPGIAVRLKESVRRLLGRYILHGGPGQEWPHFFCRDQQVLDRVRSEMRRVEES